MNISNMNSKALIVLLVTLLLCVLQINANMCDGLPKMTYLVDPQACDKFYICLSGKPQNGKCPEGKWFDLPTKRCDFKENVNCRINNIAQDEMEEVVTVSSTPAWTTTFTVTTTTPVVTTTKPTSPLVTTTKPTTPAVTTTVTTTPAATTTIPVTTSTTTVTNTIVVTTSQKVEMTRKTSAESRAEEIMISETTMSQTDSPRSTTSETFTTESTTLSTTLVSSTGEPGIECPKTNPRNVYFIASNTDCEKYYICYNGKPEQLNCLPGMHWNSRDKLCDIPMNAKCIIKEPPFQITTSPFNCPRTGVHFYPHPDVCEYFVFCNEGNGSIQQCPFYYHWDITSRKCLIRPKATCLKHRKNQLKQNTRANILH